MTKDGFARMVAFVIVGLVVVCGAVLTVAVTVRLVREILG